MLLLLTSPPELGWTEGYKTVVHDAIHNRWNIGFMVQMSRGLETLSHTQVSSTNAKRKSNHVMMFGTAVCSF